MIPTELYPAPVVAQEFSVPFFSVLIFISYISIKASLEKDLIAYYEKFRS